MYIKVLFRYGHEIMVMQRKRRAQTPTPSKICDFDQYHLLTQFSTMKKSKIDRQHMKVYVGDFIFNETD